MNDGLGQSQVFCLVEDNDGYIWMGTRGGGLSRYDGEKFVKFTIQDGLPSNYLWSAAKTQNGNLWFGTDEGLVRYDSDGFVINESVFPGKAITALYTMGDSVLIGSNAGFGVLYRNIFRQIEIDYKGLVSSIHVNGGVLYVGSDAGLHSIDLNDSNIDLSNSRLFLRDKKIRSIHQFDKSVLVGTYGDGLYQILEDTLLDVSTDFDLVNTRIHSIASTENHVWIATQLKGIFRIRKSDLLFENITENQGLSNNHIRSIISDSWGNVWIGTSGGGVSQYIGQSFDYYSTKNGLPGDYIYSISSDCDDRVWVSTSNNGLVILDNDNFIPYKGSSLLPDSKIRSVLHSLDSLLWLGYDGRGIALIDTDTVVIFNTSNGLKSNYIRDLLEDGMGNIWAASAGGGISVISKNGSERSIKTIGKENGLPSSRINQLLLDRSNRLWFTSVSGGAGYILDDSVAFVLNTENGLLDMDVNSIEESPSGAIWLGTAKKGLLSIQYSGDSFNLDTLTMDNGLVSNICYQITCDLDGNMWVGSEKGLQKLVLDDGNKVIETQFFGYEEGFQGVETTQNASFLSSNGDLWFGTIKGLSRYSGNISEVVKALPKLRITKFSVNSSFEPYIHDSYTLPFDSNLITIGYKSISQHKSKEIVYQHRLVGLNDSWSESTANTQVVYAGLEPGTYHFMVRSTVGSDAWTETQSIRILIETPYWKTFWFLVICVSVALLLVSLLVVLRIRQIKGKASKREADLRIEKELLELEQKALRLQMNPHFIFNALNSIQAMISGNDPKTARYYLAKFSKLMRQVLDNSRQSEISLEREIETLENYLSIERFCHNNRFEYEFNIPNELEAESILIPPILIQPFVENAIMHGVSQLKYKGLITIMFEMHEDALRCVIRDNGIGREAAGKQKSQIDQKHKSTALLITQERLDKLNSDNDQASIEITDLHMNKIPCGTEVHIRIKLGSN